LAKKKRTLSRYEQRRMRTQQIIFSVVAVIIILVFIISLVAR